MATGGLILAFLALIAVVVTAAKTLYSLGMQGYETSIRLAHLDGPLAGAKAQLEVHRLMRDIQSAKSLSYSGSRLIQTFDRLEEALRPITDMALGVGMAFLVVAINFAISGFKALTEVMLFNARIAAIAADGAAGVALRMAGMNGPAGMVVDKAEAAWREANAPAVPPAGVDGRGAFNILTERPIQRPRPPLPPLGRPDVGP